MPALNRVKTDFTGVYYIVGKSGEDVDRIYYIRYRKDGKLFEKKVGSKIKDNMSAERAFQIRLEKLHTTGHSSKEKAKNLKDPQKAPRSFHPNKLTRYSEIDWRRLKDRDKLYDVLSAILRSSSDGIVVADHQGNFLACNESSAKLTGVQLKNYVGHSAKEFIRNGIIDESVTLEVLKKKKQVTLYFAQRKIGEKILITGTPVFNDKGGVYLVVLNERDVTQLNLLRDKLEQTERVSERYKSELNEINLLESKQNELVAENEKMRHILRVALKLGSLSISNILLLGESGTGKGMLAKFIHETCPRKDKPFIQINCAAIPEQLLEAELFGYEKGAFTGASTKGKVGLFEMAHGGTLFLDEIGELPLSVQAKLLKYLDDQEIVHIGGVKPKKVDCIVIAATNQDLNSLRSKNKFREDLYYRLAAFNIKIPPLRERPEDINKLAHLYLQKYNKEFHLHKWISPQAVLQLEAFPFHGNVRELKNKIKNAVVLSEKNVIDDYLLAELKKDTNDLNQIEIKKTISAPDPVDTPQDFDESIKDVEKKLLKKAMEQARTTREMAQILNISQARVVRKLKLYGLKRV